MSNETVYRLADRRRGTALLGLTVPQLALAAAGIVGAVLIAANTRSAAGVLAGLGMVFGCGLLVFMPVGGQPSYEAAATLAGFLCQRAAGRHRWAAPLPLLRGTPEGQATARQATPLPACLAGIELLAVPRPGWAGSDRTLAPIGLVRDRHGATLTVVVGVRGDGFSLLDPSDQHLRLAGWAQVLSQFAREASPVTRLGWSLWSAPAAPAEHLDWLTDVSRGGRTVVAGEGYRQLLEATGVIRSELRVWLTVDPRRMRANGVGRSAAAVAAAEALVDRCAAAGLVCSAPLSPVQIAEAMRIQADPSAMSPLHGVRRSLAARAGLSSSPTAGRSGQPSDAPSGVDMVHAAPLAVETYWDAVRVDGAWHRVFWIAQWPSLELAPGWWDRLLLAPTGARTVAVVMEPVPARMSRRRINAESVSVQGQVQLRERHAFRVPVGLQQAQAEVDQRESELQAGFPEYGYLALVAVTGADRQQLDAHSHALMDSAAQCGIVELRPLHGRHDLAWACTLPIGRTPGRRLLDGGP